MTNYISCFAILFGRNSEAITPETTHFYLKLYNENSLRKAQKWFRSKQIPKSALVL